MNKQRRADLLLVMTTFFWGASYYLTDICLDDLPPMTLNAFRFIVAFVVLGLIFWKHVVHVNRITLRYSLIVGLALAGTYVAYNYGITRTSLSNAAFICALQVIFAPLLGFLFFRQILFYSEEENQYCTDYISDRLYPDISDRDCCLCRSCLCCSTQCNVCCLVISTGI